MVDIWMDVDTAVTVPINLLPLIASSDFKTVLTSETYDEAGLELIWNFVTTSGVQTHVAVTPTDTGGSYDWVNVGHGMYNIEIPATGGASANNDTEGFGWFTGIATDALAWRGPVIGFRRAALNDLFIDGGTASSNLEDFFDGTGYVGGTARLVVDLPDAPNSTALNAIADALLKRDWTSVTGEAARSCLNAFRILRNARSVSGSTLSIKKEDDSTDAWTASVSTSASAETILGVDPS